MAFPTFWTKLSRSDWKTVTLAMFEGSFALRSAGSPSRDAMLSTIEPRSSVTAPLLTLTAPLPPLTTLMNSWSAARLACAHSAWTRGLWSAVSTACTAALRSAPAAGAASPCSWVGRPERIRPATLTLA